MVKKLGDNAGTNSGQKKIVFFQRFSISVIRFLEHFIIDFVKADLVVGAEHQDALFDLAVIADLVINKLKEDAFKVNAHGALKNALVMF